MRPRCIAPRKCRRGGIVTCRWTHPHCAGTGCTVCAGSSTAAPSRLRMPTTQSTSATLATSPDRRDTALLHHKLPTHKRAQALYLQLAAAPYMKPTPSGAQWGKPN